MTLVEVNASFRFYHLTGYVVGWARLYSHLRHWCTKMYKRITLSREGQKRPTLFSPFLHCLISRLDVMSLPVHVGCVYDTASKGGFRVPASSSGDYIDKPHFIFGWFLYLFNTHSYVWSNFNWQCQWRSRSTRGRTRFPQPLYCAADGVTIIK